jgi:hypothetical protein
VAWQVAIGLDKDTDLCDFQVLLGQMPVWALATPERNAKIRQLSEGAGAIWAPDPAFTVFTSFFPDDLVAEVLNLVPIIEEHHYRLSTLRLFGIESTDQLNRGLGELGYRPVSGTIYPGLGFAKPLDSVEAAIEIRLDASGWQLGNDVYQAFFRAVGSPSWHGRNFDALVDSIGTGGINEKEVPYRIIFLNADAIGRDAAVFLQKFEDLILHLKANGCPVEMLIERGERSPR